MKLAEALLKRAELKKAVEELKARVQQNVCVQEGENPFENPVEMLEKAIGMNEELAVLVKRINMTNNETVTKSGTKLSSLLADRDSLLRKRSLVKSVIESASNYAKPFRFTKSEIKTVVVVDVKKLQELSDEISREYRSLDTTIQGINWQTELM